MPYILWVRELLGDGRFVVTNCSGDSALPGPQKSELALAGNYDVPIGTLFDQLLSMRKAESKELARQSKEALVITPLLLVEVELFHKKVGSVPYGHHAAIRLEGEGIERLISLGADRHVYLLATARQT